MNVWRYMWCVNKAKKALHSPFWLGYLTVMAARTLDTLSSLPNTPGQPEMNPFSRHADGTYWVWHGFIMDVAGLSVALGFGLLLRYGLSRSPAKRYAWLVASVPFWYEAWHLIWNAILPNLLIDLGLYVELRR